MQLIKDYNEILEKFDKIKKINNTFITNFYPNKNKINLWIENNVFLYKVIDDSVFLFRNDIGFYHLYFISSDKSNLELSLNKINKEFNETFVVDLIGKSGDIDELSNVLEKNGFTHHGTLLRMSMIKNIKERNYEFNKEIILALVNDIKPIHEFLLRNLDIFIDQIPSESELNLMIKNHFLLVYKNHDEIGGVFYFEKTGITAHIRECVVDEKYRHLDIALDLLNTFYNLCKDCVRFILWINIKNILLIRIHRYNGYEIEDFKDNIFVKLKK